MNSNTSVIFKYKKKIYMDKKSYLANNSLLHNITYHYNHILHHDHRNQEIHELIISDSTLHENENVLS